MGEQKNKRQRFFHNGEGSGGKKSSVAVLACGPAATVAPPVLAPSPVAMAKPAPAVAETTPLAAMPPAPASPTVVDLAAPSSAAVAPQDATVEDLVCENKHFVCHNCGGDGDGDGGTTKHCVPCGRDVNYTRSRFMDVMVDVYTVECLYKRFGCSTSMAYHSAADHAASCRHAPCYCFDCRFDSSPVSLVRHLTARHSWPVEKIQGNAKPLYTGVLWVDGPPAAPGQPLTSSFQLKATVASCSVPGEVDMEQGWLHAHVDPNMMHGESGELHLRLCLTKLS
ncbi:uncharacterized protein LOC119271851 [Triticum dicoccoides]|uniref:uncharacterized protein LOC119271851 n=1 Tax=Triticum dicoccoides TaxID=85692 RepID=UPI00188E7199|nr:uncharacterized protein LOC119271851 [Triticum dicoccoides]